MLRQVLPVLHHLRRHVGPEAAPPVQEALTAALTIQRCHAKVRDLFGVVGVQEQVLGLDVALGDALTVQVAHTTDDLPEVALSYFKEIIKV